MTSAKRKQVEAFNTREDHKTAPLPNWAPDGLPSNVAKLIEDEQYLEDLGLRGLSSADGAELHQSVRNLQRQLGDAFARGTQSRGWRRRGTLVLLGLGWLLGAACGAAVLALFGP